MAEISDAIDVQCTLGEGPVWDERTGCLWWTDIQEQRLYRWGWSERNVEWFALPERLGSLGLTEDCAWLVCAFASGFALFKPSSAEVRWLHKTEPEYRGIRMNDGRVDPGGNFWAGSMVENAELAGAASGSLYCLAPDGTVTRHLDGIGISNAISFPSMGDFLYFADTLTGRIEKLVFSPNSSSLKRELFAIPTSGGAPDGAIVDAEGCLWNAEWGGARLTSYYPDGTPKSHLELPVSQPTCAVFGGPDLQHLFVTTAREGLSQRVLSEEPEAGKVLILKPGVQGLRGPRFPLNQLKGAH